MVTDVPVSDVPDEVVAVTFQAVESGDLRAFAEVAGALADPQIMGAAWQ